MKRKLFSGILIFTLTALIFSNPVIATEIGEGHTGTDTQAFTSEETDSDEPGYVPSEETDFSEEEDVAVEPDADETVADEPESDQFTGYDMMVSEPEEYNISEDVVTDEVIEDIISPEDSDSEEYGIVTLAVVNGFGQGDDGNWYYYVNGQIAVDTNSVIKGVVNDENAWWYVENGKVDFTYNGFAQNSNGWWYIENGKVTFNKNSVIKDTGKKINGSADWWYVVGSKVQTSFTGLADYSNSNGWWYIEDGRVSFSKETVAKNKNGWYYVKDSKVVFSYNGFAQNSNGWWYIENGKVTFNKNSVIKDTGKKINGSADWWYVVGSKVQTSFTGLADYKNSNGWWYIENGKVTFTKETVAKNKNGWYYVKDSKVDFSYNGFAQNSNGWWYIENGKVTFNKNSVIKDNGKKIANSAYWWYVVGSKVQSSFTGLADYKNSNGWWYIESGKVTFTKETVAKNKNGWYYVKDSKVDFNYNGIAQNSNGWWYIKNGKVDFSAGDYSFAANTSQIIDVRASGNTGTLTLYNKNGVSFTQKLSTSCYLGRNGVTSNKSEGDGKTPTGVYTLGQAFGVASDPGCTRSYLKLNSNYYWVDDSTSKYYNQLVDITKVSKDWSSAEHLIDNTNSYKYAIAIDYNTACTPYKGSAIFLHCSVGSTTSGCVAVSESNMIKILQSLTSDTRIYIH